MLTQSHQTRVRVNPRRRGPVLTQSHKKIVRGVGEEGGSVTPLSHLKERYPPSMRMATCRTGLVLSVSRLFRSLEIIRPDPMPTPAAETRMYRAWARRPSRPRPLWLLLAAVAVAVAVVLLSPLFSCPD